jgi:hypothetical protein
MMPRALKPLLFTALILCSFAVSAPAHARGAEAIVWVADDGGLGIETAKSVRRIAASALNEHGVETAEPPEADGVHALDDAAKRIGDGLGVEETYVLRLSRLGEKIVVTATLYDDGFEAVRSREMTALSVEELETTVPRLVLAVARDTSTSDTAEVDTVTKREGEPWNKKFGEFLFGMGILLGGGFHPGAALQYGLDLKIAYEMKFFRVNVEIAGAVGMPAFDDALARGGVGVSYLMLARDWSPYVGASVSYLFSGVAGEFGAGVGFTPHIGVEGFRLHKVRFLVELGTTLPVYEVGGFYAPIGHGAVCILW